MFWTITAQKFGIDALSTASGSVTLDAAWHIPVSYQLTPTPEFEIDEVKEIFGYSAQVSFISAPNEVCRQDLADAWRFEGIVSKFDWDFNGTLSVHNGRLLFTWFVGSEQFEALTTNLKSMATSRFGAYCQIRFVGHLIVGDLGVSAQEDAKTRWQRGEATIGLVGLPSVNVIFGDDLPLRPDWSEVVDRHREQV